MSDLVRPLAPHVCERVVERLGLRALPEPDLAGLDAVYGAYCRRVPFDSIRGRIAARSGGSVPGASAEETWQRWLADGTGGTCWAASGALGALLSALGFTVVRALGTTHAGPFAREPNHGTLVVELDDRGFLVDTSITTGVALALDGEARPGVVGGAAIRTNDVGETVVFWRPLYDPIGIVYRLDRIGVAEGSFAVRREATGIFSIFHHGLHARIERDGGVLGIALGMRIELAKDGTVRARRLDAEGRVQVLVEELGIREEIARRVPPDEPVPPPPGVSEARWARALERLLANLPTPTE